MLMILCIGTSILFAVRYAHLSKTVDANQSAMRSHLLKATDSAADASLRVANAVASDERLFDETLVIASAKRTAGLISLIAFAVAVLAIGLISTDERSR